MVFGINQVLGNYRLIRLLGRGGFADVYLAEHIYLKTSVAIKVLSMQLTNNDIEYFSNEARIIASLDHPHILRVFDFGIERGIPYLVMDYAPNGTLRQRHPKGSCLSPDIVVLYVKQIASALQYIHDRKLIHRDIKPENLLIGRNNEILISDFGIATVAHSTRSLDTGNASGTIHYMAPEQIQGKPRLASDQYALGIVIYEWLCGTSPFKGTVMEIGMQHLLTAPQRLSEINSTITEDISQIVLTTLAKDPHQRYETIQTFARELERVNIQPKVRVVATCIDKSSGIKTLMWSPDNQFIALKSGKYWEGAGSVCIWDAALKNKVYLRESRYGMLDAIIWLSGSLYISSSENRYFGKTSIFSTCPEKEIITFAIWHNKAIETAWSPNGKFIAIVVGSERYVDDDYNGLGINKIEVRDTATGEIVDQYDISNDPESLFIAWSPDSKYIAMAPEGDDSTIAVWQVNSPLKVTHCTDYQISAIAWSHNGRFIASGNYQIVAIWDPFTGDEVSTYQGHIDSITAIAWSPNNKYIVSSCGGYDHIESRVHIWDISNGENIYSYGSQLDVVEDIAWSPDGKHIVITFKNGKIEVWDVSLLIT